MTSKHARLSILVVTLTLSACTASGGAPQRISRASRRLADRAGTGARHPPRPRPRRPTTPRAVSEPRGESGVTALRTKPTVGPQDPCSLLTSGRGVAPHRRHARRGQAPVATPDTICTWAKGTTEVKVFLTRADHPDAAKAYYEAHKSEIPAGAHPPARPGQPSDMEAVEADQLARMVDLDVARLERRRSLWLGWRGVAGNQRQAADPPR